MNEKWKTIPGYSRYEVSNLGRVRSYATKSTINRTRKNPRILKLTKDKIYYRVKLHNTNGHSLESVHRLVLIAFVGPCPDGYHACHNNGNPLDNRLSNLRWDTVSKNHLDKTKHETMYHGEKHHFSKFTEEDIKEIRARADTGELHRIIANDYGVTRPTISFIVNRTTWAHVE